MQNKIHIAMLNVFGLRSKEKISLSAPKYCNASIKVVLTTKSWSWLTSCVAGWNNTYLHIGTRSLTSLNGGMRALTVEHMYIPVYHGHLAAEFVRDAVVFMAFCVHSIILTLHA